MDKQERHDEEQEEAVAEVVDQEVEDTQLEPTENDSESSNEANACDPQPERTSNEDEPPGFVAGICLGLLCAVVLFVMVATIIGGGDSDDATDERLLACEKQIATLNEKCGISTTGEAISSEVPSDSELAVSEAPAEESEKAETDAQATPQSVAEQQKSESAGATLSPAQVEYFCEVLVIGTNDSQNPEDWDSPEECALGYWDGTYDDYCDSKEYFADWLKVAAHPATTSTFLHYLAYRCDDTWFRKEEDAVKLAKLVLAHKACDDECLGYLSASDFQRVRDLVYERLLSASE